MAANEIEEEEVQVAYIPPNFREGSSIAGFMVKPMFAVQAVPWAAAVLVFIFTAGSSWDIVAKIVTGAVLIMPVVVLCVAGINGDSVYRFIYNVIRTARMTKLFIYDAGVKIDEKRPGDSDEVAVILPRDRIMAFINKRRQDREPEDYENYGE